MIPGSTNPLLLKSAAAAAGGLQIERSIRLNSADSAYLSRTPGTAGNRRTWTWSGWVKIASFARTHFLFGAENTFAALNANGTSSDCELYLNLRGSSTNYFVSYASKLRDPSAWYHLVFAVDTTQGTPANILKVYINGVQATAAGGLGQSFPPQNDNLSVNNTVAHTICGSYYFDGYLANIHFIDGQALTPSSFTETDATTGQLIPKTYTGSYGTNGFNLLFADNSSNTASTLGKDTSPNGNNWTPNNFSVVGGPTTITTPASNAPPTLTYLVVAGGGGGGATNGGGGGAGGYRNSVTGETSGGNSVAESPLSVSVSQTLTVTVGSGGAANTQGENSVLGSIVSIGGGGGANVNVVTVPASSNGGSGGGAGRQQGTVPTNSGTGTAGQGFAGGIVTSISPNYPGAGGGGAGGVGVNGPQSGESGDGGPGLYSSITGSSVARGGGGGGAANLGTGTEGSGGVGGGGAGLEGSNPAVAGTPNTGGGGGGGGASGTGGSGIVIIRYANTYGDLTVGGGLTYTYANTGGYKIYSFTASVTPAQAAGNDSLVDSPVNGSQSDTGVGGEVRGNYCTLNPLDSGGGTVSNGNLEHTYNSSNLRVKSTISIPATDKWYAEFVASNAGGGNSLVGIATGASALTGSNWYLGNDAGSWGLQIGSGTMYTYHNGGFSSFGTANNGDVIGVAVDRAAGKIWWSVNNTWIASGDPANGTNARYSNVPATDTLFFALSNSNSSSIVCNWGQRAFAYTAPSGFKALNTANLPAPLVTKSNTVFDIRSGLSAQFTISDLNFTTGLVVGKSTNNNEYWIWADVVRSFLVLRSNTTDLEGSGAAITNVSSTGYQSSNNWFTTSRVYVTYNWDAGSSTVSNTAGSITNAMVRANTSAGFSVVTYTGTGANATVGHGLGVAPGFIIIKNRSALTNWRVYHSALGNTKAIFLSTTGSSDTSSAYWNNTSPTSTVFSVGSDDGANGNTNLMVAYCFTPVVGYSSFGSYTGNGSSDGPFVYTGFRPRWILLKQSSSSGENWRVLDTARSTYNPADNRLLPNSSAAEAIGVPNELDTLSNGFKFRATDGASNGSGATYIYAAFAEAPFNYSRAR